MILMTVSALFAPENLERAVGVLHLQGRTRAHHDCKAYDVCTDPGTAGRVFIHQVWASTAAFDAYRQSDDFAQMSADVVINAPDTTPRTTPRCLADSDMMAALPSTGFYDAS